MLPLFPLSYFIFFIFQSKKCYEKVGEATETALIVLVEKMNVTGIDLTSKTKAEKAHTCNDALRSLYKKVFFSLFFHSSISSHLPLIVKVFWNTFHLR